jgi:hypothetical protein
MLIHCHPLLLLHSQLLLSWQASSGTCIAALVRVHDMFPPSSTGDCRRVACVAPRLTACCSSIGSWAHLMLGTTQLMHT